MGARWRLHFPKIRLRLGPVALFAVGLQVLAILLPTSTGILRPVLYVSSYLVLFAFVAANWRRLGILVIGIGLVLNFLPIVANGGLMPVTAQALQRVDQEYRIEGLQEGDAIPWSKNVYKAKEDTHLYLLTDRVVREWGPPTLRIISIGDIFVAAGLVITLGDLLLPRLRRVPAPDSARGEA